MKLTRRDMFASAGAAGLVGSMAVSDRAWSMASSDLAEGNTRLRQRIALSDLSFTQPAARSEEGTPIGNGRMGSLVWTTPSQIRLQINRVDLYPAGAASNSFNEAHNDYCGGFAFLDLSFEGRPFAGTAYREHLSVYDGTLIIEGDGVRVTMVPVRTHDVFAISIEDRRSSRPQMRATLRMLRFAPSHPGSRDGEANIRRKSHVATSRLHALDGAIALSQHFREADYSANSAVAVRFIDGLAWSERLNETEVCLTGSYTGTTVLLVGSAASFSLGGDNVVETARAQADVAAAAGFARLATDARQWWHDFWEEGSLALRSDDGTAQAVQQRQMLRAGASCSVFGISNPHCERPVEPAPLSRGRLPAHPAGWLRGRHPQVGQRRSNRRLSGKSAALGWRWDHDDVAAAAPSERRRRAMPEAPMGALCSVALDGYGVSRSLTKLLLAVS